MYFALPVLENTALYSNLSKRRFTFFGSAFVNSLNWALISDTVEYGIYRIICSEPTRACEVLRAAGISASMSEVFAITLDNRPGRAADAVRVITGEGIGISYLYSFLLGGKGILVFRTDDAARTEEVIRVHQLGVLDDEALMALV